MVRPSTHAVRLKAWQFGRSVRDDLIRRYRREYGMEVAPPPALIVDELMTDILGVRLRYDPLPISVYAETTWEDQGPVVTINTRTADIPNVKDSYGVQNVGKWHELVHVVKDVEVLRERPQEALPGFDVPPKKVCFRARTGGDWHREFWAEEAGRAAAICHVSLSQSKAFNALTRLATGTSYLNSHAWALLRDAATDIGVNTSALVRQLRLEGRLVMEKRDGRQVVTLQATLADSY